MKGGRVTAAVRPHPHDHHTGSAIKRSVCVAHTIAPHAQGNIEAGPHHMRMDRVRSQLSQVVLTTLHLPLVYHIYLVYKNSEKGRERAMKDWKHRQRPTHIPTTHPNCEVKQKRGFGFRDSTHHLSSGSLVPLARR